MKKSMLKPYAALALNEILSADSTDYISMPRSKVCLYIQDNHNDIEKEIAIFLESVWNDISSYESCNIFKKWFIHLKFFIRDHKAAISVPDDVIESIVDVMLPDIIAFFETEEGRKEYEEWKAEQQKTKAEK